MYWKRLNHNCNGNTRDKVALRKMSINLQQNVKLKIIKRRTGCQYVGYFFFYYSERLYWATQKLRLGRGLDIAGLRLEKEN